MNYEVKSFDELTVIELYEILKVRSEVFVVEQECPYQDCDGKDADSYHLLCKDEDNIVGYLRILKKGISYDEISIGRVLTAKSHRGKNIGRIIMEKALEFITNELNESKIRISAQEYLLSFYESLGFIRVSETYLEDDIPHVEMLFEIN